MLDQAERWQLDDLVIDVGTRVVTRGTDEIVLPQLSFEFLLALLRAAPNVLSSDQLMETVWAGVFVNSETVTQRAKLLRDALGEDHKEPRYFTVRRGVGYLLVPVPQRLDGLVPQMVAGRTGRRKLWVALGAAGLALAAIGIVSAVRPWSGHEQTAAAPIRVAVLPFDNFSADPADAYVARSIPELVLNRLSSVRGLTVISRESSLLGNAHPTSAKDAAQRLDAAYMVQGSVQRLGATVRVTCFVVDTATGSRLWSERYDWPVDNLYALQDRIAERVAATLETRTAGIGKLAPADVSPRDTDAYLAYLKGKSLIGRFTVAETDQGAAQFERAVKLDPQFAPALVALMDARMQAADLRKDDLGPVRARYGPLLERALEIAPASGEALFAKAMWMPMARADRIALFRQAARADASNSRGLTAFAEFLEWDNTTRDNPDAAEGRQLMERVLSIDPLSVRARFWSVQRRLGELTPDELEREQAKALELDPDNYLLANRYAIRAWRFHGETAQAIERIERVIASDPQNPWGPHLAFAMYLDAGDPEAARAIAATTPATRDSSRVLLAQYRGDWQAAGQAALGPRSFLFNQFENWNWARALRDLALHTGQFDRATQTIASRYGFDLSNPRTTNLQQSTVAAPLAQILIASGQRERGDRLLGQTLQWFDAHPKLGLQGGTGRTRADALMLLGETGPALSLLRATTVAGQDCAHWWYLASYDPIWTPVRDDPRFREIIGICHTAAATQKAKLDALRRAGKVPLRRPATGS